VADLAPLAGLRRLASLELYGAPVSDLSPLAELPAMREAERLDLSGTAVASLAGIEAAPKLRDLRLIGAPVRDVAPLGELDRLQVLWLAGTQVDDAQVAELQRRLPDLEIVRD
jgi:Leucine-rich repeat (LRR) protein